LAEVVGFPAPDDFKVLDVGGVYLVERRVFGRAGVAAIDRPFAAGGAALSKREGGCEDCCKGNATEHWLFYGNLRGDAVGIGILSRDELDGAGAGSRARGVREPLRGLSRRRWQWRRVGTADREPAAEA